MFRTGEGGFLLPVALFILIAMSVFAAALWRSSIQTSNATVQELISAQALFAAESGAQVAMAEFLNDSVCSASDTSVSFSVTGLNNCSATWRCRDVSATGASAGERLYEVTSTGVCQAGAERATRTIEVGVRPEDGS